MLGAHEMLFFFLYTVTATWDTKDPPFTHKKTDSSHLYGTYRLQEVEQGQFLSPGELLMK